MEAGRLRYVVEIQSYTTVRDSNENDVRQYNGAPGGDPPFASVHADIVTTGGRELFAAQQQFAEANAVITMRYVDGVNERMRVYHPAEDIYYDILNAQPSGRGRREWLTLICRTGISATA